MARAVAGGARDRGLALSPAESFTNLPGQGVAGRVGGRELLAGQVVAMVGGDPGGVAAAATVTLERP